MGGKFGEKTSQVIHANLNSGFSPVEVHGGISHNRLKAMYNFKERKGIYKIYILYPNIYNIKIDFKKIYLIL